VSWKSGSPPASRRNPLTPGAAPMKANKDIVRISLTPAQKAQIKEQTGKDADTLELKVSELEERIAPRINL